MENATKALTMAASVLIALVIIGAILLVFNNLSAYQKVNDQVKKDAKVIEFNSQFDTYDRSDVRGSDLLSLVNRVIDYNERQSYVGNEGSDLGYKPIKLTINVSNNLSNIQVPNADATSTWFLIKESKYIIDTNKNNEDLEEIINTANTISDKYSKTELTELAVGISSIFLTGSLKDTEKAEAVRKYYNITGEVKTWSDIQPGSTIRKDIYQYYEYIQFKRTYFDCKDIKYDDNGRITEMYFEGNGNVE